MATIAKVKRETLEEIALAVEALWAQHTEDKSRLGKAITLLRAELYPEPTELDLRTRLANARSLLTRTQAVLKAPNLSGAESPRADLLFDIEALVGAGRV